VSITYPSYKCLDSFIDVERLRSLDGYVAERLMSRLAAYNDLAFYTGPFRLQETAPDRPGSRMVLIVISIWISQNSGIRLRLAANSRC
jgi:hypothetical protein